MRESLYIQQKYLSFAAAQLDRFKRRDDLLWNCRCPYCGDSSKSKTKARGYIYRNKEGLLSFQCHNCGENHHFRNFLRFVDGRLADEYVLETLKGEEAPVSTIQKPKEENRKPWRDHLVPIAELSRLHPARDYIASRKIPKKAHDRIFYSEDFREFVHQMRLDKEVSPEPRLVFVETDRFDNLKIVVARAIMPSELRYITLMVDEDYPKLFGLGRIDHTKPVTVVEGAIDSLFLPNCVAALDANLTSYRQAGTITSPTLVWDNEPRSRHTTRRVQQAIQQGEKVCIWPSNVEEKDINEMVLRGLDPAQLIEANTYRDIPAMLAFSQWTRA